MTDREDGCVYKKLQPGSPLWGGGASCWVFSLMKIMTPVICLSRTHGPADTHLTLRGIENPFGKQCEYPGTVLDTKITWQNPHKNSRHKGRAFGQSSRARGQRRGASLITVLEALIRPTLAAAASLGKLRQTTVLPNYMYSACETGLSATSTTFQSTHRSETYRVFRNSVRYVFVTKLCRQQTEVIRDLRVKMLTALNKGKENTANMRDLKVGGGETKHRAVLHKACNGTGHVHSVRVYELCICLSLWYCAFRGLWHN